MPVPDRAADRGRRHRRVQRHPACHCAGARGPAVSLLVGPTGRSAEVLEEVAQECRARGWHGIRRRARRARRGGGPTRWSPMPPTEFGRGLAVVHSAAVVAYGQRRGGAVDGDDGGRGRPTCSAPSPCAARRWTRSAAPAAATSSSSARCSGEVAGAVHELLRALEVGGARPGAHPADRDAPPRRRRGLARRPGRHRHPDLPAGGDRARPARHPAAAGAARRRTSRDRVLAGAAPSPPPDPRRTGQPGRGRRVPAVPRRLRRARHARCCAPSRSTPWRGLRRRPATSSSPAPAPTARRPRPRHRPPTPTTRRTPCHETTTARCHRPRCRRQVAAPAEAVWAVLADGWQYATWVVGASRVRAVDAGWPAAGHPAAPQLRPVAGRHLGRDGVRARREEPHHLVLHGARAGRWARPGSRSRSCPTAPSSCTVSIAEDATTGPWEASYRCRFGRRFTCPRNREALRRLGLHRRGAPPRVARRKLDA